MYLGNHIRDTIEPFQKPSSENITTTDNIAHITTTRIHCDGRATIPLDLMNNPDDPDTLSQYSPCVSFGYSRTRCAGFVVEVRSSTSHTHAQVRKELRGLANDYILGSNGNVRTFLGVRLEREGSKRAIANLYRRSLTRCEEGEVEWELSLYLVRSVVCFAEEFVGIRSYRERLSLS